MRSDVSEKYNIRYSVAYRLDNLLLYIFIHIRLYACGVGCGIQGNVLRVGDKRYLVVNLS